MPGDPALRQQHPEAWHPESFSPACTSHSTARRKLQEGLESGVGCSREDFLACPVPFPSVSGSLEDQHLHLAGTKSACVPMCHPPCHSLSGAPRVLAAHAHPAADVAMVTSIIPWPQSRQQKQTTCHSASCVYGVYGYGTRSVRTLSVVGGKEGSLGGPLTWDSEFSLLAPSCTQSGGVLEDVRGRG